MADVISTLRNKNALLVEENKRLKERLLQKEQTIETIDGECQALRRKITELTTAERVSKRKQKELALKEQAPEIVVEPTPAPEVVIGD